MDLLSYQKGDILFSNCQTLVNPVSCDGTIDSYLSKRFFMRYPAMYAKYLQFCKEKLFTPGKLWVYQGKNYYITKITFKAISSRLFMPINLIRSRSINYIQRKWFHYQTFIYLGYTPVRSLYSSQRLLVISATRAFLRSFAAINLFIAASRFSQNSLSNVSIIVLLLNSLIAICRQNYSFFLKPPRKSQEICKLSENYYKKRGICIVP